jgi:E3 ubiquitin-protein ligase RNF115/126
MGCQASRPIDDRSFTPNISTVEGASADPQSLPSELVHVENDVSRSADANEGNEHNEGGSSSEEPSRNSRLGRFTSRFRERRARNRRPLTPEEELEQLQHDLETMERLFRSLLGHSFAEGIGYEESFEEERRDENYCPPASRHAMKNLPTITVTKQDLQDECNRECCICFFEHSIDDKVVRLPCGHLFHHHCISEWLNKRCTCPICRWEMETDDKYYEDERIERMRKRRLRLKSHDLQRMSVKELKELAKSRMEIAERKACGNNKSELIKRLRRCSNVDIVPLDGEEEKEEISLPPSNERKLRNFFVGN